MATSLLRLGRLGSLKCLRQDSWGTLRTPLTAALCTKTEGPKKPAKKAKAASKTLEASDERASLLAYKTAVAFPTRLSAPGFVSALSESVPSSDSVTAETVLAGSTQTASTEEINDPAPTLTTAVSEAVPETPPEPPKAAPSEEVTDVAPEVAVAEPAPSITEVSAEASTTGEVASSNQGESATKQPEATPVAESVAGNDASSKTIEAGEATGSGAAKKEEATSSSSSSSESDSDSDSDDEGPDKSEKTKVVGQPEEKAGQEKVPTDSSSEVKATEAVASESVAVPESSEKAPSEAVIEPVTEATAPSTKTEGSTQTASTEEINDPAPTLTTAVSEAVPETPSEPPKAAVSEEVTDVAPEVKTEAADEIVTEKEPGVEVKTSEAKTEAVPEAVSVAEVIPEAKAMPDVEAIPEASDKAAADTAEVPDIQAKAEPEIILDSAEEVPSEPIAEAVAAPPAEMLVDTAPTIADAGEPSPEAEVAAAPEEPAPEPEPEPFDNTTYKNLQHHSYNIYTFVDMDVEMAKHRLPQPSSGRPSPRD